MTKIKATNIKWHDSHVNRAMREELLKQKGCTIWLTGLPASGKSTTAFTLEHELVRMGYLAYVLDGDNIRHGLNKNLGFSPQDREENIRRVGEVAKLFADSGIITLTSFISPYRRERELARKIHDDAGLKFIEVFVDTPVDVCRERDPKGLYAKAQKGIISGFTGVDAPYESPINPEIVLKTADNSPKNIVTLMLDYLYLNGCISEKI
ncbi:adenylyl-sulfate kinase [bacterium]|nr:adenylyl-sulfate kinase [bacterium]